jgi:hypothetical protein
MMRTTTSAWLVALLAPVAFAGVGACTTPPVGWEGAGRLQTLPMQQPDSSPPGIDSGDDSGGDDSGGAGPDPGAPAFDGSFDGGLDGVDDSGVTDAGDAG